ncbi:hypothetical protein EZV62_009328 [Acer yangbiense]|uniref:Uncharacterized protein n=1 Tax=Acer yangbiense TaxID=1000413 RepID=A0A5C7IFQ0_9ROSI|nr:hypothetical protein EZV62_009328 [Acer yangbiense]
MIQIIQTPTKMAKSAKLMPSLRRSHQSLSISNLFNTTKQNPSLFTSKLHPVSQITTTGSCVTEMRKVDFEDNIRREIQYELQQSPSNQLGAQLLGPGDDSIKRSCYSSALIISLWLFDVVVQLSLVLLGPGDDSLKRSCYSSALMNLLNPAVTNNVRIGMNSNQSAFGLLELFRCLTTPQIVSVYSTGILSPLVLSRLLPCLEEAWPVILQAAALDAVPMNSDGKGYSRTAAENYIWI